MPDSPGGEFVPLESPLTPRTPRDAPEGTPYGGPKAHRVSALSPHNENVSDEDGIPGSAMRLTPGPAREWVFRDDEISTDTRSTTTEMASEVVEGMSSQDEEGDFIGSKSAVHPRLNLINVLPHADKGALLRSPRRRSPRTSIGAGLSMRSRGIEVCLRDGVSQ